jgi:two-component system, chemotaxis family, sensor histidine kinase and response regulator WspE
VKHNSPQDLSSLSMLELFRTEADTQIAALTEGLLKLEQGDRSAETLAGLMRAAHSLKGAARIANFRAIERLAHALEDCFETARTGTTPLENANIDLLLRAVDVLANLVKNAEDDQFSLNLEPAGTAAAPWMLRDGTTQHLSLPELLAALAHLTSGTVPGDSSTALSLPSLPSAPAHRAQEQDRILRLTAENLNRLLGLAGESLVESRWLKPFSDSLQQLKRQHLEFGDHLDKLRQAVEEREAPERIGTCFNRLALDLAEARDFLAARVQDLDAFDRRSAHLSQRLYLEVLRTRMRPFSDGVRRFPRLVRDLARSLNKQVRIEIHGESTQVDRDILERLETPLGHLLRNAVDHGCESPQTRVRSGKPPEAVIRLDARHSAGVLLVTVADDGAGVQLDELRQAVVGKKLATVNQADKLSEPELLEFLFIPGFTLKEAVTEISGRGYGLDIVQNMVRNVRGAIRLQNQAGRGFRVQLQLPLTLSVLRALLVEIAGEPYAIPLSQISRTLTLQTSAVQMIDGQHYFPMAEHQVRLVPAHQILETGEALGAGEQLSVVVLGDRTNRYGLIVDRFLGERELVVQPLQTPLQKIKDVSAAALMEDGAPVLILDVEELVRSMQTIIAGHTALLEREAQPHRLKRPKRILIVDDSSTVRQLGQRLLAEHGYLADVAVDGLDAWTAVRSGAFDLVITDIEMPRMDGFELARAIKQQPDLQKTAVLIISYRDREEDRLRGLEAGADYYLTKGTFHDQQLLQAVVDLIGEPGP